MRFTMKQEGKLEKKKCERTDCRQHAFLSCIAPVKKLTRCASFKSWDVGFPELVMWFRVEREQRSWHLQTRFFFFNHYFAFDPHPTLTLFWSWSILWQCLLGVCWLLAEKKGKKNETVDNVASAAVTVSDHCCSWQCCFFFSSFSPSYCQWKYEHCIPCATVDANAHMLHVLDNVCPRSRVVITMILLPLT